MRTRNTRISVALLLVLVSLLLASTACYSGQLGMFELTPFYTPTPLGIPETSRFSALEQVLAPQEAGRTFFNLTVDPEQLSPSLVNSKSMCQGDSAAQVLFVGVDHNDDLYYLINCVGSVGWVAEERLAGPLMFAKDDLALTVLREGSTGQSIELLDDSFRALPFNPLQSCKPETVVRVNDIIASDPDGDDLKDIFYQVECPTTGGPLKGWVTNADLFGPVELDVDGRALAFASEGEFQMANEPAPVSEENVVETDCAAGDILITEEVQLVDDVAYYSMTCGEDSGWVTADAFVGPLNFEEDVNVVVYVPSIPVFADDLAAQEAAAAETDEATAEDSEDVTEEPVVDEAAAEGASGPSALGREVVEITPPLYLTENPGPAIVDGDDANVVAECSSGMVAHINEYAAADTIYYYLNCNECTVDDAGDLICEERTGWGEQQYLQGPVDFVIGQQVAFEDRSSAIEEDENGVVWARIPPNIESAGTIGSYTKFAGRCLQEDGLEITGIVLEKDRTRNQFSFFYAVQCTGQSSTITEEKDGSVVRPKVEYNDDETLVTGYASGRDLVALGE